MALIRSPGILYRATTDASSASMEAFVTLPVTYPPSLSRFAAASTNRTLVNMAASCCATSACWEESKAKIDCRPSVSLSPGNRSIWASRMDLSVRCEVHGRGSTKDSYASKLESEDPAMADDIVTRTSSDSLHVLPRSRLWKFTKL